MEVRGASGAFYKVGFTFLLLKAVRLCLSHRMRKMVFGNAIEYVVNAVHNAGWCSRPALPITQGLFDGVFA